MHKSPVETAIKMNAPSAGFANPLPWGLRRSSALSGGGLTFRRRCLAIASSLCLLAGFAIMAPTTANAATITSVATMDTYAQRDRPATNFGTSARLSTEGRAGIWRHTFLRFNVQVPAGQHVVSAKLRAYSEASAT